jgi:hypothetical protein
MNILTSRLHTRECIERCLSQAVPRMQCKGCSDEYRVHLRAVLEPLTVPEREKILAILQAE